MLPASNCADLLAARRKAGRRPSQVGQLGQQPLTHYGAVAARTHTPVSHGKEMGSEGSLGAKHMVWGGPYEAVGGCRVPTGGHSVINMGGTAT